MYLYFTEKKKHKLYLNTFPGTKVQQVSCLFKTISLTQEFVDEESLFVQDNLRTTCSAALSGARCMLGSCGVEK